MREVKPLNENKQSQPAKVIDSQQDKKSTPTARIRSTLPMDDPEFREIAADFVLSLGAKLQLMRQALSEDDFAELGRLAHWLKGSGGTCGFPQFSPPAKELEQAARLSVSPAAAELLQQIEQIAELLEAPAEFEYR